MSTPMVTRFAPSPTGHLHIGGARTALFCWAFAKRMGGRFMLRIEDTDAARSSMASARGIMDDLAWLGIDWDDGPEHEYAGRRIGASARDVGSYFQAQRVHLYDAYVEALVRAGRAYPAFEDSPELEKRRQAAVAAKKTYRYERPEDVVEGVFNEARWARAKAGEAHVVRFLARHEAIVVKDEVLGDVKIAAGELDDFVIRKADGLPTYHFAVVIDDETMGVTHVLRAQEHLANTPRHVALQRALLRIDTGEAFRTPTYAHMPLIFNMDGTKMSKRDKAKAARKALKDALVKDASLTAGGIAGRIGRGEAEVKAFIAAENDALDIAEAVAKSYGVALPEIEVADFREAGYEPSAILNFLSLLGWNPGLKTEDGKDLEKFDMDFLARSFSLDRIGKTNSKFDRAKLLSFNADAIAKMSDETFLERWMAWMEAHEPKAHATLARWEKGRRLLLARTLKPRAKTYREALRPAGFALVGDDDLTLDAGAVEKHLNSEQGRGGALLRGFRERLAGLDAFTPEGVAAVLDACVKAAGLANPGPLAQAIRVAVAGVPVTPGIGETLAILGRESSLRRIDRALGESRPG